MLTPLERSMWQATIRAMARREERAIMHESSSAEFRRLPDFDENDPGPHISEPMDWPDEGGDEHC